MFVVKAVDGSRWFLPSLMLARKFAWRKSWGYPKGERLEIFNGKVLVATETIWRGGSNFDAERQRLSLIC
jgi:hypothetical protein